ncbi:MAG: two component transcriptional regulator, LuxR family [Chthoniobacteraceae bacterium]|nr:two component transcriptional regulator, LuxR family [Chthoniobacteraceae bacterium]
MLKPNPALGLVRVVIVDDHPWVRLGLISLIGAQAGFLVCGEAETAQQAIELLAVSKPDLAIVDISLKGDIDGIELTRTLKRDYPAMPILVLSMHAEPKYATRALEAGANGYMTKSEAPEALISTLFRILNGEIYLSAKMAESSST